LSSFAHSARAFVGSIALLTRSKIKNFSSDPYSSNYAKFWTAQEVVDAFAPSDETVSQVRKWLNGSGIDQSRILHTNNKGWLAFVASGKELEDLLHTEYSYYTNNKTSKAVVATEKYVLCFSHCHRLSLSLSVSCSQGVISPSSFAETHTT
jgi:subtilase family serine protease